MVLGTRCIEIHASLTTLCFYHWHRDIIILKPVKNDILKLFSILLPSPAGVPPLAYVFKSNFEKDTVVKQFRGSCIRLLERATSCTQQRCIEAQLPRAVFVQIPLSMQRFEGMCMHTMA